MILFFCYIKKQPPKINEKYLHKWWKREVNALYMLLLEEDKFTERCYDSTASCSRYINNKQQQRLGSFGWRSSTVKGTLSLLIIEISIF